MSNDSKTMKVAVYSDYVCPFCYMAKGSLEMALQRGVPLEVEWRAFELRPEGSPPMDPAYRKRIEEAWPQTRAMAEQFGVVMNTQRFGLNTRPAHRAYKIAQRIAPEQAEPFNTALYRAYWELDQDISDPEVLVALAESFGIDGASLREGLQAGEAQVEVVAEEELAQMSGISGVPAFVFADKYLVSGVRPPEFIESVVEQIRQREG